MLAASDITYKMPTPKQHLHFLDSIRGVAILCVFFFHCLGPLGAEQVPWSGLWRDFSQYKIPSLFSIFTLGWIGVPIFFVVSGFCIHLSYIRSMDGGWREFFVRRFFRLYPAYLVALLIFAFAFPYVRLTFENKLDWWHLVSHLLLIHNFDARTFFSINPAYWSIAAEVQLYLLYPVLILATTRGGWQATLWALGMIEVSLRVLTGLLPVAFNTAMPQWLSSAPLIYWFSWAIGAALADAYLAGKPLPFRSVPIALWLFLTLATNVFKPLSELTFLFVALLTATLISQNLSRQGQPKPETKAAAHLRTLGAWSYSFYLLHQPILMVTSYIFQRLSATILHSYMDLSAYSPYPEVVFSLCMYPIILFLSGLFYRYCELPGTRVGKRFTA
jgi:peptidoglycan/LPS O-acetylase OafA/YrhL